jgi:tRNA pseudouridine55 synthase
MTERHPRRDLSGVLLINKPLGPTSQQAVAKARWLFAANKAGHGGTLDPLATGLLIIGFGEATKYLQRHLDGDKTYVATVKFGAETITGDAEGEISARTDTIPTLAMLQHALPQFVGPIVQTPPQYSALKVNGRPAYDYARAGETVALAPREITIHGIDVLGMEGDIARLRVTCSKGTYIRTLGQDLARASGSLGHLIGLVRERSGGLDLAQAHALETLEALPAMARDEFLLAPEVLVASLPRLTLPPEQARRLQMGQRLATIVDDAPEYAAYSGELFLGTVMVNDKVIHPVRLISIVSS